MKIALLTIWHEKNYGAELQAYATIKILQNLGYDVNMINIRLSDMYPVNFKNLIVRTIEQLSPNNKKFEKFWRENIPVTIRYRSVKEIQDNPPQADIYIVGSDQVWNPIITNKFSKLFFLNFGSEKTKRISIASSFGQEDWPYIELIPEIKKLLSRFQHVSCREDSGLNILSKTFGIQSAQILDPTLLIDSYTPLFDNSPIKKENKLVYYPLSDHDNELHDLAIKVALEKGLTPFNINRYKKILNKIVWNRPSVSQWLTQIAGADFVITRSFHGIAFSIIFNKQFAVLKGHNNRTTRLTSLLKLLNLEQRIFENAIDAQYSILQLDPIDYNIVNMRLNELRKQSIKTIKSMIEE